MTQRRVAGLAGAAGAFLAIAPWIVSAAVLHPGRLGSAVTLEREAGRAAVRLAIAPALAGPWPALRIAAVAILGGLLLALAVTALLGRAPRTRPPARVLGTGLVVMIGLGAGALSAAFAPGVGPEVFPATLCLLPLAALASPRHAAWAAVCAALAGGGGAALARPVHAGFDDLVVAAAALAGGLAAATAGARCHHPAQLVTGGLLVGAAQGLAAYAARLGVSPEPLLVPAVAGGSIGLAAAVGLAQGIGVRILLPAFERVSGRLSAVSLARFADPSHPLLERLRREAPGTFHHSQAVGQLAAAAADAMGGDTALARAGGLFHDIGKIRRPDAFGENTPDTCHRKLPPGESAALILAHVRDGIALAREYRLPAPLAAFIPEHHGTTTVEFFYTKAKEAAAARGGGAPRREDFSYAGPKPQTLESALVHLADSAEASSRSLENPSVNQIRDIVEKIFKGKATVFQFDECPITGVEMALARDIFIRELSAARHSRPKYPDTEYPSQISVGEPVRAG